MMKPVTRFLGRKPEEITMIGGGAMSGAWCQIFADALGVAIRRPHDPMKANARGAAFIAAAGLGLMSFHDVARHVRIENVYEPDAARRHLYDERFGIFTELHRRLAPLYKSLNGSKGKMHGQVSC
jgi:xylulokinase